AANKYHSIYYHKIGDNQENDKLIYQNKDVPLLYHYGDVTEDFKYFILYVAQGTEGYECYYKDLTKGLDAPFTSLFTGFKNKSSVVYHENGKYYVQTNIDAPNYKLVEIDLKNSEPKHWKEIIPTSNRLLQSVTTCGGKFFADYLESASS